MSKASKSKATQSNVKPSRSSWLDQSTLGIRDTLIRETYGTQRFSTSDKSLSAAKPIFAKTPDPHRGVTEAVSHLNFLIRDQLLNDHTWPKPTWVVLDLGTVALVIEDDGKVTLGSVWDRVPIERQRTGFVHVFHYEPPPLSSESEEQDNDKAEKEKEKEDELEGFSFAPPSFAPPLGGVVIGGSGSKGAATQKAADAAVKASGSVTPTPPSFATVATTDNVRWGLDPNTTNTEKEKEKETRTLKLTL